MSFSSGKGSRTTPTTDSYWNKVVCLLHADPVSGGNNITYTDTSAYNTSLARGNGLNQQGAFTPYAPSGYSMAFTGTDWLTTPYVQSTMDFFASDFTIECWVNPKSHSVWDTTNSAPFLIGNFDKSAGTYYWGFGWDQSGRMAFRVNVTSGTNTLVASTNLPNPMRLGDWVHIAAVFDSATRTIYLYAAGTLQASGTLPTVSSNSATTLTIGAYNTTLTATNFYNGIISNLRMTKSKVYTGSTYTVPTSPLAVLNTTSTSLLLNSPRFIDSSLYDYEITVGGTPWMVPFTPFNSGPYVPVTDGGSLYSGIAADYVGSLSATQTSAQTWLELGNNDFTIEFWAYPLTTTTAIQYFFSNYSADTNQKGLRIGAYGAVTSGTNGGAYVLNNAGATLPAYTTSRNMWARSWNHIAVVRADQRLNIFQNGKLISSTADVYNYNIAAFTIGNMIYTRATLLNAYTTDLRITKGIAMYTGNFTPPTNPVVPDVTPATITRAGYAAYFQTSLSQYVSFTPPVSSFSVSSKFCLEFWVYFTANPAGTASIVGGGSNYFYMQMSTTQIKIGNSGYYTITVNLNQTLQLNAWYHIAVMGDTYNYVSVDGVVYNTNDPGGSNGYTHNGTWLFTGLFGGGSATDGYSMYVRDYRLTTGTTVYNTSGFARPTAPLTNTVSGGTVQFLMFNNNSATLTDNANSITLTNNGAIPFVSLGTAIQSPYPVTASVVTNLNFNTAAFYDAVGKNGLATGVTATTPPTVTTSVSKFGLGSVDFTAGTTFYRIPNSPIWDVAMGEYMFDFWIYPTNITTLQTIFAKKATTTGFGPIQINISAAGKIVVLISTTGSSTTFTYTGTTTLTQNAWNYVSFHKYNSNQNGVVGQILLGVNGNADVNTAWSSASGPVTNTTDVSIGSQSIASNSQPYLGYLGEFRFTRSARGYSASVPPVPTAPFPKQ
jgi:hypothetical protein